MATASTEKNQIANYYDALGKTKFSQKHFIMFLPVALFLLFTFTLALPFTRSATIWMLSENRPIEILTFFFLIIGAGYGLKLAFELYQKRDGILFIVFYVMFSAGLLLTGLEEIAWGQQFLAYETPDALKGLNEQGEMTFHNIRGIHGKTEAFRLLFGIGGLVGIWLGKFPIFKKISTPTILAIWFLVITLHAAADVFDDIFTIPRYIDAAISKLAELVELLIGIAGFLYIYINSKMLTELGENAIEQR